MSDETRRQEQGGSYAGEEYFNISSPVAKMSRLHLFLLNRLKRPSIIFQGLLACRHHKPLCLHSRQKAVSIGSCLNIVAAPHLNPELRYGFWLVGVFSLDAPYLSGLKTRPGNLRCVAEEGRHEGRESQGERFWSLLDTMR